MYPKNGYCRKTSNVSQVSNRSAEVGQRIYCYNTVKHKRILQRI